jgi:uncharacterized protein YggT (Ycf19 family)
MSIVYNLFITILNLAFYIVLFAFMLRMLFQLFKVNAQNPIAISIASATNIIVLPLRQYLPRTRYIDLSTFVCWLIIDIIKYTVIVYLNTQSLLSPSAYLYIVPADFIMQMFTLIFYSTLFYTIISFVAPGLRSVGMDTLRALCEPVLRQARKIISPAGGFDFAPVIVLLLTKFTQIAITKYIPPSYFF